MGVFGAQYLRTPNAEDTARILARNEARGFPGCLEASTACIGNGKTIHFLGRGCTGAKGHRSVVLEVVATHDL